VELSELFSEHGIALQCETRSQVFTAESAESANDEWKLNHPVWLIVKQTIGDERFEALSQQVLDALKEGNEADDGSFRFTSKYLLALGSPV
jgi:hypothetical protein